MHIAADIDLHIIEILGLFGILPHSTVYYSMNLQKNRQFYFAYSV